jgi:hypothetical protein
MWIGFQGGAALALLGLAGCAGVVSADKCTARVSDLQVIGSHNSYKLAIPAAELALIEAQAPEWALALDYGHLRLTEQLDLGMRQLELDVYYDPEGGLYKDPLGPKLVGAAYDASGLDQPGFKTLHVQDVDARSTCYLFTECLSEIQAWSEARPDHVPMLILINAKQAPINLPGAVVPLTFDAAAFDALDAEIRSVFDTDHLLTPDDVRGDAASLRDAVLGQGWPSLDEARGKVFFALDEPPAVVDVYRRGARSLNGHAMFINSTAPDAPDAAYFTINDPVEAGAIISARVSQGFVVRTRADANTIEARSGDRSRLDSALASGAQYISTDYYQPRTAWSDYVAKLPNGETVRANPLSTCGIQ